MNSKTQTRIAYFCLGFFVLLLGATIPQWVTTLYTYDSVSEMAAHHNPASFFKSAYARGYYTPGDGGGGMFFATNTVTSTNLGTRIKSLVSSGWSMDRHHDGELNVRWFGAKGDGTTDDTAAFQNTQAALPSTKGGVMRAENGKFKINFVVTNENLTLIGNSHKIDFTLAIANCFIPATNSGTVIQVGNDTARLKGFSMRDVTLAGNNTGGTGLKIYGGPFECRIKDCAISFFTNCVVVQGGVTNASSLVWLENVDIQCANVANSRGIRVLQTTNYPTSWTTAIYYVNGHLQGPNSATGSYMTEMDSAELKVTSSYLEGYDDHGMLFSKSQAQLPFLTLANSSIETYPGTGAAIQSYSTNRYFGDQLAMDATSTISGMWKTSDGTLLIPPRGVTRQNQMSVYPNVYGALSYVDTTDPTWLGGSYTNYQMFAGTDTLYTKSAGFERHFLGKGLFQLENYYAADKVLYLRMKDGDGITTDIRSLGGFLKLIPGAGAGVQLTDSAGNPKLQVNGADGAVFLLGPSLNANSSLYLDANRQLKSTPTGTATLDFASTAAQTSSELTITATGAAVGDCVILGVPATANANSCYTARVTAADTVTVKFNNYSAAAIDPASGSFKVTVLK